MAKDRGLRAGLKKGKSQLKVDALQMKPLELQGSIQWKYMEKYQIITASFSSSTLRCMLLHLADGQQVLGMLTAEYETMTTMQEEVRHIQVNSDACNEEFRHTILGTLEEMRLMVKSIMDMITHRATNDDLDSAKIVDTGETQLHVTCPWCNAVLGLLNLLLETTLRKLTCPTIPSNICTICKKFNLDPVTQTFATCTRKGEGGKMWMLMLSWPGIEEAMDYGTMMNKKYHMWDIKDGTAMQEILGTDRKPFLDGLKRQDLRLAWSLSVDWFNPHGNKTSGKKKSVGEHRAAAEEWKSAETKSEHDKVFKQHRGLDYHRQTGWQDDQGDQEAR
ncbi:uncharacterized protein BJ212DRAFT_1302402 [Suillus subaureus]|uniref:Uncharacterized protein n=1 Tax=Suillus subaureus TaxID=48587 RepID=A0A9P7E4E2_9AGAM|nr:uncharacterized protein BJ212DRAFT_1302402 [Suillus subaureus]KAG1810690.1 hypothetical protein BJ212DRAFT_1302402 [Suillus subaureus]